MASYIRRGLFHKASYFMAQIWHLLHKKLFICVFVIQKLLD